LFAASRKADPSVAPLPRDDARLNHHRFHHLLDRLIAGAADVITLRSGPRAHDALHFIVLEVDPRVVVARVARLHLARPDQLLIQRPAPWLAIVMRRVASLEESEALYRRQLFGPRVRRALL